ncbi:MAG TPA: hypothetical protein VJR58_31565 [Vineibacter sp.]|nr:hypothetical protein [Vineibacter sp.]
MTWNDHTVVCTYRVKPGAREAFLTLLRKHWPALRDAGLATATPALHFEAVVGGDSRHNETGTTFVEIFSWSGPEASQIAHNMPAVMAVWEPMGALVEARDGRPAMEFPSYRPLDLDA